MTKYTETNRVYDTLADTTWNEFIETCREEGLEFPCTAEQFQARAAWFARGNDKLINALCRKGI